MKRMKLLAALLAIPVFLPAAPKYVPTLPEQVRHELVTLPWLGVFDDLRFRIDGDKVTLLGQVNRPTLRSSAERVVKNIEGVAQVDNQIEVLPLSPFDDRVRIATARSIYGYPALQRYALGAIPGIHILVKNGNVTLGGVVATKFDSQIAYMRAMQVPGVFSVSNQLTVEGAPRKAL